MRLNSLETVFVHRVPDKIEEGILYVCMECNLVVHLCPCGCGEKVVLPIDSNQWILSYDGSGITLLPSVGNYQFKCKSHYYIRNSEVVWIPKTKQSQKKKRQKNRWFKKLHSLL